MAAALLAAAACTPEEKAVPEKPILSDYLGTVTVTYQDADFDNTDIKVHFEPSEDGSSATLVIYAIRFVPQMPVEIDVTIPGVAMEPSGDGWTLTGDGIVPFALGGEYPRYLVTGLNGSLKGDELSFSLLFGASPTRFTGTRIR